MGQNGPDRVNPFLATMMIADSASAQVSILLGAKGPNFCSTSACSSSADAIGVAYETIKRGDTKVMIAGGSEAVVNAIGVAAFLRLQSAFRAERFAPRSLPAFRCSAGRFCYQ